MKKSQVLDVLQNFFQSDCAFETAHDARISAERVLSIVEKLGMLAPTRTYTKTYEAFGISDCGKYKITDNSWEQE